MNFCLEAPTEALLQSIHKDSDYSGPGSGESSDEEDSRRGIVSMALKSLEEMRGSSLGDDSTQWGSVTGGPTTKKATKAPRIPKINGTQRPREKHADECSDSESHTAKRSRAAQDTVANTVKHHFAAVSKATGSPAISNWDMLAMILTEERDKKYLV